MFYNNVIIMVMSMYVYLYIMIFLFRVTVYVETSNYQNSWLFNYFNKYTSIGKDYIDSYSVRSVLDISK